MSHSDHEHVTDSEPVAGLQEWPEKKQFQCLAIFTENHIPVKVAHLVGWRVTSLNLVSQSQSILVPFYTMVILTFILHYTIMYVKMLLDLIH